MSDLLVTDIGCLVTNEAAIDGTPLGIIHDAAFRSPMEKCLGLARAAK